MEVIFVILLIFIFVFFYFYHYNQSNPNSNTYNSASIDKEKFESECWTYGDDYNSCYANSNCTIGFLPDGSTHCMKKFLQEDI